ncbi:hypothetical protein BD779DRAFT_1483580 [Infundibulicybe gibba]|nr:hypothetical protein BD779DRAFT_1483580 [Infundibulicybe gibba]
MPKSEREEILSMLTSMMLSSMVDDIVLDAALQAHHEVARSRAVCGVCNTRCNSVHVPGPSNVGSQVIPASRPGTPLLADLKVANGASATGTSTPTSVKADGSPLLDCVNCSRQIAASRYAPHLSSCMGLATARRGAVRGNTKTKQASDIGRSTSPVSDADNAFEGATTVKGKGKGKKKRTEEAEFNLKRKRLNSPQISPNKKQKKQKISGSPVARVKGGPEPGIPSTAQPPYSPSSRSLSKIPSKLRDSSTASFLERSPTPGSSRSSSPDGASAATPSSSFSMQSPNLSTKNITNSRNGNGKPKPLGVGPPKRLSPPRPPPMHVPDYVDVGDETGSSTDTDSS